MQEERWESTCPKRLKGLAKRERGGKEEEKKDKEKTKKVPWLR